MRNPFFTKRRVQGGQLIELAVTFSVSMGLLVLLITGASHAMQASRTTRCLSNIRQIHQAITLYRVEHGSYPVIREDKNLNQLLKPWLGDSPAFHCPEDTADHTDSYSYFYAPRSILAGSDTYMIGCSRHEHGSHGVTISSGGESESVKTATILHNGKPIAPGASFGHGEFQFADGSRASISVSANGKAIAKERNGNAPELPTVSPLISTRDADGKHTTVIKFQEGTKGTANFSVVPGNRFEVITPSAIIAVRGTQFSVQTLHQGGKHATRVTVIDGEVDMEPVGKGHTLRLKPGDIGYAEQGRPPHNE